MCATPSVRRPPLVSPSPACRVANETRCPEFLSNHMHAGYIRLAEQCRQQEHGSRCVRVVCWGGLARGRGGEDWAERCWHHESGDRRVRLFFGGGRTAWLSNAVSMNPVTGACVFRGEGAGSITNPVLRAKVGSSPPSPHSSMPKIMGGPSSLTGLPSYL